MAGKPEVFLTDVLKAGGLMENDQPAEEVNDSPPKKPEDVLSKVLLFKDEKTGQYYAGRDRAGKVQWGSAAKVFPVHPETTEDKTVSNVIRANPELIDRGVALTVIRAQVVMFEVNFVTFGLQPKPAKTS